MKINWRHQRLLLYTILIKEMSPSEKCYKYDSKTCEVFVFLLVGESRGNSDRLNLWKSEKWFMIIKDKPQPDNKS